MPTFRLSRRAIALATLALLLFVTSTLAQMQTGNLYGEVIDNAGAALPGVTVTVMGADHGRERIGHPFFYRTTPYHEQSRSRFGHCLVIRHAAQAPPLRAHYQPVVGELQKIRP